MTRHATNWLCAAALALLLSTSYLLDGPSALQEQLDTAQAKADAIAQAAAQHRYQLAAQQACGPNAAWAALPDGSVQCKNKRGRNTIKVSL